MAELTKEDIKQAVKEAMAEKFEITFGIDCTDPGERDELREDMKFLRAMKKTAATGGQKLFFGLLGLVGTGAIAFIWPELQKYWKQ